MPNPWRRTLPGARTVTIKAGKNLTYSVATFNVRAGEPIKLTFINPDVVPRELGARSAGFALSGRDFANKIIAGSLPPPYAVGIYPGSRMRATTSWFTPMSSPPRTSSRSPSLAPAVPGRYPHLCTFPGHWMVMNGVMVVE